MQRVEEFILGIAFALSLHETVILRMVCNNQRTCSTVGRREELLETLSITYYDLTGSLIIIHQVKQRKS